MEVEKISVDENRIVSWDCNWKICKRYLGILKIVDRDNARELAITTKISGISTSLTPRPEAQI